ncbi:hypothetical protein JL722_5357 [Aureococcus anophagefferens]|nr:hypothetical protein JL722_5357 [Aureococcus anophagefferens]
MTDDDNGGDTSPLYDYAASQAKMLFCGDMGELDRPNAPVELDDDDNAPPLLDVPPAPRREATPAKAEEPPSKTPQTKKKTSKTRLAPRRRASTRPVLERQRRDTSSREARKSRNQPAYSFAPQLCGASPACTSAHNRGGAAPGKSSRRAFLDRQNRAAKAARVRAKRPDDDLDDARSRGPSTTATRRRDGSRAARGRSAVRDVARTATRGAATTTCRLDAIRRRLAAAVAKREGAGGKK